MEKIKTVQYLKGYGAFYLQTNLNALQLLTD